MYDYRQWTPEQRVAAVAERKLKVYPWHGPPHIDAPNQFRLLTGTCFEHREILTTKERLAWFESELLGALCTLNVPCAASVVLPNHYHILVLVEDMKRLSRDLGKLHGRTSFEMNKEDGTVG